MPLDHPFPEPPAPATLTEVAPGVHWLRMPLPFALDHINLWAIEDGDDWVLVDTGVANDETRALWTRLLAGRRVSRLICTHFHPDHMGLAGWIGDTTGAPLWTTLGEWLYGRMLWLDEADDYRANQREFYRRAGWDDDMLAALWGRGNTYRPRVGAVPTAFRRLRAGDELSIGGRSWRVMVGEGHAPEHASLWCAEAGVLISGDQVLPRISPIVGVWPQEPDSDQLGLFLGSLPQFRDLPADALVLPSHGLPFLGLHERVDQLLHHHDDRLARTREACAAPATALDVVRVLFRRPLDPWQTGFATGETLAHLNHLIATGEIRREARPDGVWTYRRP